MTKKSKEDAATSARRKAGARELGVLEGKLARKKKGERKTPQGQWATSESLRKTGGKLSKNEYNTMASNYNREMLKGKDDKDATPEFGRLASKTKGGTESLMPLLNKGGMIGRKKKTGDARKAPKVHPMLAAARKREPHPTGGHPLTPERPKLVYKKGIGVVEELPKKKAKGGYVKKYAKGGGVRKAR